MDKKTIITIVLATLLALVAAFIILNKNTTAVQNENNTNQQEEIIVEDETSSETEKIENKNSEEEEEEIKKDEKALRPTASTKPVKSIIKEAPSEDKTIVQEASITKDAEPDYGIRKIGETIEVTREFKVKSPTKYSFKDFGILDNVSTK